MAEDLKEGKSEEWIGDGVEWWGNGEQWMINE